MFAKEQSHCQRYGNGFENDDHQYVIFVKKIKDMKDLIMNLDFICLYWNKRKCACVRQFYIFLKVTLTIKKVSVEKNTKSRKKRKSGVVSKPISTEAGFS